MDNKTQTYRLHLIEKLKDTQKTFANRIASIMEIDGISDLQVERTMTDCIIELEKLLEDSNKREVKSKANNNCNIYRNITFN